MLLLFLVSLCFYIIGSSDSSRPVVKIRDGLVRGVHANSLKGRIFSSFEGIPYAKPPVGSLRFKELEHPDPWTGVWEATTQHKCIQVFHETTGYEILGKEDCIYIQVHVPRETPSPKDNLDVLVNIHGGCFMFGSPTFFGGPNFIMDREAIYINFNYRVGPLGFLSTEDEVLPGNLGLKDQVFALKWIRDNIKYFGGNPDSVMIFGVSSGGGGTHYHYLSEMSKGLFHTGHSISGTAFSPWTFQEAALEKTKQLASYVGCDLKTSQEIVDCLRQRSAHQIYDNVKHFFNYTFFPFSPFGPVVEKGGKNPFLTDHPYNLIKQGKVNDVPWLVSLTSGEGIFPVGWLYRLLDDVESKWNELMPHILDYNYTIPISMHDEVSQKIKKFYMGDRKLTKETFPEFIKMNGDRHMAVDAEKAARLQAKVMKSPVYFYLYDYQADYSFSEVFLGTKENIGVSHIDDFVHFLSSPFYSDITKNDEAIIEVMLDIETSFAKGKPTVNGIEWTPLDPSSENINYLQINSPTDIKVVSEKELSPTEFWKSIPFQENEWFGKVHDEL